VLTVRIRMRQDEISPGERTVLEPRPFETHGVTISARLRSVHHFSFASFMSEERSGWGGLTTLNHIVIPPGVEVGPNPVDGVDLIRIVRRGVLGSFGTLGLGLRTLEDEVEVISAGSGITLGDRNLSRSDLEYVELRLAATRRQTRPSRALTRFPDRKRLGEFVVLASGYNQERQGLSLQAPARISACRVRAGQSVWRPLGGDRAYLMVLAGQGLANGYLVKSGDGMALADEPELRFTAHRGSELLLIEARDPMHLQAAA
jgi:quercetin 2,3-dioxygenase